MVNKYRNTSLLNISDRIALFRSKKMTAVNFRGQCHISTFWRIFLASAQYKDKSWNNYDNNVILVHEIKKTKHGINVLLF